MAGALVAGLVLDGRYRLEHVLGEGGMGVVWAAAQLGGGPRRAIKLVKEDAEDPDALKRFGHEARSASAVRHPHVVEIIEVLELPGGRPALVMELLEGETLREVLARRPRLPLGEALRLLLPVIAAVGAAHALGVVHRDLKPENIFLARGDDGDGASDDGVIVKILDFGIAKLTALDGETMRTTGLTTGKVLGTPTYMAPEQVYGQTDLDHRVDVWALGLVFYQALSGVLPTAGDNIGQVFRNVTARPFPPLGELVEDVPEPVAALIGRMLARDRAERPAELGAVIEELRRAVEGTPAAQTPLRWPRLEPPAKALRQLAAREAASLETTAPQTPQARRGEPGSETAAAPRSSRERALLATAPASRVTPLLTGLADPAWPPGKKRRLAFAFALAASALALAGGLAAWRLADDDDARTGGEGDAAPIGSSPLSPATAKLACPVLQASGVDAPAGWLGAAAAAIACERARVLLGGRPERTLAPAELLDLPRGPADAFPVDPYGAADARARSIAAAKLRAAAYLDGEIAASSAGFAVTLTLRRPDGQPLAGSDGRGRSALEAVRAAMALLVHPDRLPRAAALEPEVATWARTEDPELALAAVDLTFAFAHNAGGLPEECRRFAALGDRLGELGVEGRWMCAYVLGRPAPEVALGAPDGTAAGIATHLRLDYLLNRKTPPDAAATLHALLEREATPRGRAALAASESCLRGAAEPRAARELAIIAVQSEPKNPEGGLCNPWEQLMTLERDTAGAEGALRAMQGWVPWNGYAWLEAGYGADGRALAELPMLRRAYTMSPFDAQIAGTVAATYLAAGDRAAARGVALALRGGGLPLHQLESDLLLMRVEASEARFAAALERAMRGTERASADAGWVHAQRFEVAWHALELAVLLGRSRPVADQLIARFLEPEPPLLDSHFALVPMRLPAICALGSAPARCFARFRALRARLPGAITEDTEAFLSGAERYAQRDLAGAARSWRPLLGGKLALAQTFPEAMTEAFERTGAHELAERVDEEVMKGAAALHGATLGHVRAARRALAKGDRARARQLAEQVIAAWALADEPPPALEEMRRLLARLPP